MIWNSSKIKEYYETLKDKDISTFSKKEKCIYEHDLNNLHSMLRFINQDKTLINKEPEMILDEEYYQKVFSWLMKNGYRLLLNTADFSNYKNYKITKSTCLNEENVSRITYQFLKDYNEKLKEKLFELNQTSHIYYNNNKTRIASGETFNIINFQESFILLHKSDRLDSPLILTREITKASEFSKNSDIENVQNRQMSPFTNAYANFNELVMIDRVDEFTEKEKIQLKEDRLNLILSSMDIFNRYLITYCQNEKDNKKLPFIIKNILSNILAMYWYQNYQNDEKGTLKEIENFNSIIGKKDIDVIDANYLDRVFDSFNSYVDDISRIRKK